MTLTKYYGAANAICNGQNRYIDALEALRKVVRDHNMFMNILNHIQIPCVQVTAQASSTEARQPRFPNTEDAKDTPTMYYDAVQNLSEEHMNYMDKSWKATGTVHKPKTFFLALLIKFTFQQLQVTVTTRQQEERAEGIVRAGKEGVLYFSEYC